MAKRQYEYKGAVGIPAISKKTGVKESRLHYLVSKHDMDIHEAVTTALRQDRIEFETTHKGSTGLKAIADDVGLSFRTLKHRMLTLGMSIEKAVKLESKATSCCPTQQTDTSKNGIPMPRYKNNPELELALGLIQRSDYDAIKNPKSKSNRTAAC